MNLPFSFTEIHIWLAFSAIVLLFTSEVITHYKGLTFILNKKRFRFAALVLGILFAITIVLRIILMQIGIGNL